MQLARGAEAANGMDVQKTMESILEQQAHAAALQAQNEIDIRELHGVLRRAIRLAVQEARHERQRRRELDARCKERSEELEAKLDRLIEALLTSRNGGGGNPGLEPAAS
jgi:hypothetical protein